MARCGAQAAAESELRWEQDMGTFELESALDSAILSEDPAQASSALSGARVRKDHWKGMSASEKRAIFDEQFRQARANGMRATLIAHVHCAVPHRSGTLACKLARCVSGAQTERPRLFCSKSVCFGMPPASASSALSSRGHVCVAKLLLNGLSAWKHGK